MRSSLSAKLASVALGVACMLFAAAPRASTQASAPQIKVVQPKDVKDLIAANKGKVVFLNFFATYCVPCHTEFPDIEKLQTKYGDKLQVVEVSMNDVTDSAEKAEMAKYIQEQKPPFPVYIASTTDDSYYKEIDSRWAQSEALPMTMIFDKDGKEAHFYQKALTLADMEHDVDPLLAAN
ncbi:MAG TPA: TlpA disulfide reductase family protein [Candidatus Acidoferrales bacterium]|jgi:thiol-disulfide isomerase/thioredoxin|nr:TlpA disulfide reductase family protein [Candidatus Acidoferrales bacterium]